MAPPDTSGLLLEAAAAPAGHLEELAAKQLTIQHDLMRAHAEEVFSLHDGALAIIVERMQASEQRTAELEARLAALDVCSSAV